MNKVTLHLGRAYRNIANNMTTKRAPARIVMPSLAGGPQGFFSPFMFTAGIGGGGGGGGGRETTMQAARSASQRIEQVMNIGADRFISKGEIIERYKLQFTDGIEEGRVPRLSEDLFNEAMHMLRFNLIVEEREGAYRIFNQVTRINEVSSILNSRLNRISNLHDLTEIALTVCAELPETTDIYLFDPISMTMFRGGSTSDVEYRSNYQTWAPIREGDIFDVIINTEKYRDRDAELVREVKGTGFRISRYCGPNGPIQYEDLTKYSGLFKDPDEVRFQRGKDERDQVVLVTKRHPWKAKGEKSWNVKLYSRDQIKAVDAAWDALDQVIASAIGRVVGDRSIRKVWEDEKLEMRQLSAGKPVAEISPPQNIVPVKASKIPVPGEAGYENWLDRNEMAMSRFYDKFTKIFAFICRLSRAYQLSVIEGIDHIVSDFKERFGKSDEIQVVDAVVGSAYFLERMMQRGEAEDINIKATAIDLSKVACAITKQACGRFGDSVQVTKGNIARMTRFLEDLDPLEPASKDLVLLNYVLQYVPIEEVLKETNRILKPEGRLLITNFKPKESMRWDEFWTNVRASWECGKAKKFGHGRLYEMARYFLLFFRHAPGIIRFAMDIDRDVEQGIIPENPNGEQLQALLTKYGFEVLAVEDTHHFAAYRFYARKVKEHEAPPST